MKVVATKVGIYGADKMRPGKVFEIPDGEPLRSWMAPAAGHVAPEVQADEPTTLGALAAPVPDKLKGEAVGQGKKAAEADAANLTD